MGNTKPYKVFNEKEYYILPLSYIAKILCGEKNANYTIKTKKINSDWDLGSASGLFFETLEKAQETIDNWERNI